MRKLWLSGGILRPSGSKGYTDPLVSLYVQYGPNFSCLFAITADKQTMHGPITKAESDTDGNINVTGLDVTSGEFVVIVYNPDKETAGVNIQDSRETMVAQAPFTGYAAIVNDPTSSAPPTDAPAPSAPPTPSDASAAQVTGSTPPAEHQPIPDNPPPYVNANSVGPAIWTGDSAKPPLLDASGKPAAV